VVSIAVVVDGMVETALGVADGASVGGSSAGFGLGNGVVSVSRSPVGFDGDLVSVASPVPNVQLGRSITNAVRMSVRR
jgi:hypothetical protein